MVRSALARKCLIAIGFFMICPRRTNFAVPPIKELQPIVHVGVPSAQSESKFSPEHIEYFVKDKLEKIKEEPGFDLTDEEIDKFKLWPQGVIPYYIDVYSYGDKVLRDRIRGFLNTVSSITSLNFLELPSPPKEEDSRWVFFINHRGLLGCGVHSTKKFTIKGVQKVTLGYDCMSTGGELPEAVLAIVGVPPQHNSPDRDKFIRIVDQNIIPDKKYLFSKLNDNEWLFHDIEYDFASAGQYHSHRYSVNGKATIEMQEKYRASSVGETKVFSTKDILKINMLYNFISKKKQNISECHKLFEPGSNFNRYQPSNVIVLPRKKPNKYTGQSNDINKVKTDDIISVSPMSEKDEFKEEKTDTYDVSKPINKEDQEIIQSLDEYGSDDQPAKKPISLKNQVNVKKDPLSYLSDYKFSDEDKQRVMINSKPNHLAFGKPGKINQHPQKVIKAKLPRVK